MKKRLLFLIAILIPFLSIGQLDVKPNYTKPSFQGSIEVADTLQVDKVIQLIDGAVIKSLNGGSELDLKADGFNDAFKLTSDNGAYGGSWFYGDNNLAWLGYSADADFYIDATGVFTNAFNAGGNIKQTVGASLKRGIFDLKDETISIGLTDAAPPYALDANNIFIANVNLSSVNTGASGKYPVSISSKNATLTQDVINVAVLGGDGIITRTNNTAYANKIGFNSGEGFQTILDYTTATQNNIITLPDASGTFTLDVAGGYLPLSGGAMTGAITSPSGSNTLTIDNNEIVAQKGAFGVDNVSLLSLSTISSSISYINTTFTKIGQISIYNNDAGDVSTGATAQFPTSLSSEGSTIKQNVINTNILGGSNVIAKTNNAAYSNQFIFNSGEAFETKLVYTTATQENISTVPDKSGVIAHVSDIAASKGNFIKNIISPGTLTSDVDNWSPAGYDDETDLIRINITSNRDITGIVAPSPGVNRVLGVTNLNNSNDDIKFEHNDFGSSAANRFLLRDAADKSIKPNETAWFWYDHISNRWRPFNRVG